MGASGDLSFSLIPHQQPRNTVRERATTTHAFDRPIFVTAATRRPRPRLLSRSPKRGLGAANFSSLIQLERVPQSSGLCTRNSTINLTMADKRTGKVNSEKPPIDDAQQKTRQTPLGTSTGWSKPEGDLQRRIVPEARLEVERNRREPGFIAKPGSCIRAFRRAIKPGSTTESGRPFRHSMLHAQL
jgi:hypothetical protein